MKRIIFFGVIAIILFTVSKWFFYGYKAGYDSLFYFTESYTLYSHYPYAWSTFREAGFGGTFIPLLWGYAINGFIITLLGSFLKLDWLYIETIAFYIPFLVLAFASSRYFAFKTLTDKTFASFSALIYSVNSYILMVMSGGQVHFGLAYAIAPFVLYQFIAITNGNRSRLLFSSLVTGVLLTIQMMLDLRVAYMVFLAGLFYFLFCLVIARDQKMKDLLSRFIFAFLIPATASLLLLAYWVLPSFFVGGNPVDQLGAGYANVAPGVRFFSFATLENTISLMHPNWPDNIFGKVGFMRAEFLLLPILAFAALLFIDKKQKSEKKYILFFAFIGLIGAFLAKGANEPFGEFYIFLIENVPGFSAFRDSTKWYILIALSYAVLVPFTLQKLYSLKSIVSTNKQLPKIFILLTIVYFIFLLKPAFTGEFTGTLKHSELPREYAELKNFLTQQNSFFRVLWFPASPHYAYFSNEHRLVSADEFFHMNDVQKLSAVLKQPSNEKLFQESSIKYIIVPFDSEKQIFITDRKYDQQNYDKSVNTLNTIEWLQKVKTFGSIQVYEITNPKEHFWSTSKSMHIESKYINPGYYQLTVSNVKKGDRIIFSETYDSGWQATMNEEKILSEAYAKRFNSFALQKEGNYTITIYYTPQHWVDKGVIVSIVSFMLVISMLVFLRKR